MKSQKKLLSNTEPLQSDQFPLYLKLGNKLLFGNEKIMEELQKYIIEKLQKVFATAEDQIDFTDPRGDGHHWQLKIISPKFASKSRLERSRMIYEILADDLGKNIIHALQMKLLTEEECTE